MSPGTRAKRLVYLVHRWTGVAGCLLMAIWFVSGIVMLYVGYPKLTPWERLGALPALAQGEQAASSAPRCCLPPEAALAHSRLPAAVQEIVLTSVHGRPHYLLREANGALLAVDAIDGRVAPPTDAQGAIDSARAFLPGAAARHAGLVDEDRWTRSRSLARHRPLHVVEMDDMAGTRLYVSSATGQVVMDAPLAQRRWNYAGAWLHWLYMFRSQAVDPVWSWLVIVLSAAGTLTALTGTLAGLWRWRFHGRYKSGSRSPYRDAWLRWHHILGLVFALFVFGWVFSGLASMNPLGVFDARGARPDLAAYRGAPPGAARLPLEPARALGLLEHAGFDAVELEWRVLDGQPYLLARDRAARTRVVLRDGGGYVVRTALPDAALLRAAERLQRAPIAATLRLDRHDAYYYSREPEAMNGAQERRLPAWRVDYADAYATRAYLDASTGDLAVSLDRHQRIGRWLFNFLHSWDLPVMLRAGDVREILLILLSLGGLAICVTGTVIGYVRLRVTRRRWQESRKRL